MSRTRWTDPYHKMIDEIRFDLCTPWEQDFLKSMRDRLNYFSFPSRKQIETLEKLHWKKSYTKK